MAAQNKDLAKGAFWAFTTQVVYIFVGLLGNIFLARLLIPAEIGLVGIAMFFVGISSVLVESGMGGAIVRKLDATNDDYSTMFIFNFAVSLVLAGAIFAFAPYVAALYESPNLKNILRVLSLCLIFNALTIVQSVKLTKLMQFRKMGFMKLLALSISTVIAVIIAYKGYGIWGLVIQQVATPFLLMTFYWTKVEGFNRLVFSKKSFKEMFSFGLFTTLSSLILTSFDNIYQLILGKNFTMAQTGYYYQSRKFQDVIENPSRFVFGGTIYAHLSKFQTNFDELKAQHYFITRLATIFIGFITCSVVLFSEEIIMLLYGLKWLPSAYYLKLLSVAGFFGTLELLHANFFRIFNQTHKQFYVELIKKAFQVITIFIGIYFKSYCGVRE
ncbi:MAG: lipopolysaccharide biosynthesis protein [Flavobacterium sp.]|nr:MAG: lipopolysaccharide biosynthesis protein [Flavobacterium sp.]